MKIFIIYSLIAIVEISGCKNVQKSVVPQQDKAELKRTDLSEDNSKSNYSIAEKYWKLVELNGKPVAADSSFIKEPFIIFKESDSRFSGNGGCNNISGSYLIAGSNQITFSKTISTRMSCPRMDLESEFLEVLQKAESFVINGDTLILSKAMAPLARFIAMKL